MASQTIRSEAARPPNLAGVILIHGFSVVSMAFVAVLVPIISLISSRIGATPGAMGTAIALFSVPSALFATIGGSLVDRIGTRVATLGGAALVILADVIAYSATSLPLFDFATLTAGVGFTGITIAAPALIIESMQGSSRTRAMSLWSTYAPTGFSLGLLVAAPFAGKDSWATVLIVHGAMMLVLLACSPLLPRTARKSPTLHVVSVGQRLTEFLSVFKNGGLVRLSIAVAIVNGIAYGTGLVVPSYLAKTHDISMATSAATVALAKIVAMLVVGIGMGELLSRRISPTLLYFVAAALGLTAQFLLFWPDSFLAVATGALGLWLLAYGCLTAVGMALLPSLIDRPEKAGVSSGLIGQFTSIGSFLAADTYLALDGWHSFMLLMLVGLGTSAALLPTGRKAMAPIEQRENMLDTVAPASGSASGG